MIEKITGSFSAKTKRYLKTYNYGGIVVGSIMASLTYTPSLLPRGWVLQGLLVGVVFVIGYGLGVLGSHLLRKIPVKEPPVSQRPFIKRNTYIVLAVFFAVSMFLGYRQQAEVHELVAMTGEPSISVIGTLLVALLIALLLMTISRLVRKLFRWLGRQIDRLLPRTISYAAAYILTFFIVIGIVNGVIIDSVMNAIDSAYSLRNDITDEGIEKPMTQELSGSPYSLIRWDSLGKQGRKFIGTAVKADEIQKFTGKPAANPVRIYSGLESADNATARAQLAVDDLKRAGGYDRDILVVVTTTGTGWVNETSADAIEYMYGGNSAIVSMQYSYLPSWISFLVDKEKAKEAGTELYTAVYEEWLKLPEDKRPKLVVYGESLGSFGAESAFPTTASFKATSQGALLVGPPNSNSIWREVVDGRDPGTPEVLPIVKDGQTVRFAARTEDLSKPTAEWESPRAVYLQHGSDPIVWWAPSLLWSKPDWLKEPRAYDVSHKMRWMPIITFLQVSADMAYGTAVPDGYGHNYGTLPIDAWSEIAPPSGWSSEKTEALKTEISK